MWLLPFQVTAGRGSGGWVWELGGAEVTRQEGWWKSGTPALARMGVAVLQILVPQMQEGVKEVDPAPGCSDLISCC